SSTLPRSATVSGQVVASGTSGGRPATTGPPVATSVAGGRTAPTGREINKQAPAVDDGNAPRLLCFYASTRPAREWQFRGEKPVRSRQRAHGLAEHRRAALRGRKSEIRLRTRPPRTPARH